MSEPTSKGRVLVTGATSFIGSHIINLLLQEGWEVRGTVRGLTSDKTKAIRECMQHLKDPLDLVEANLKSTDGWDDACRGCEYVIHTACPVEMDAFNRDNGRYLKDAPEVERVTDEAVNGALYLIRAAKRTDVKRVVLTSSIAAMCVPGWTESFYPFINKPGVFDPNAHEQTISEDMWSNEELVSGYILAKTKAERESWREVQNEKLELTCINPSVVFGPQLHAVLRADSQGTVGKVMGPQPPPKKDDFIPPGTADMRIPVVDVRDVAKAHVKAMILPEANGQRYLVCNRSISAYEVSDICDAAFSSMGYNVLTKRIPKCMVGLLGLCDPLMSRVYKNWGRYPKIDNRKFKALIGAEPIDLETSVRDTVLGAVATNYFERKPGFKTDSVEFQTATGAQHVELKAALA